MTDQIQSAKIFKPIFIVLFFVLAILSLLIYQGTREHAMLNRIPEIKQLPDFRLVNQSNETVTLDSLKGYFWVASFIFTNCAGSCPTMVFQMAELQNSISEELPVRFVSITVDPDRDTPEVLYAYAERVGAEHDRWFFLTGEANEIYALSREGFLLGVDPEGGTFIEPIMHSQRFVLVDDRGVIRGYYDGFDEDEVERLRKDLLFTIERAR